MSLREKIEAEASFKISKKHPFIFAAHSGGKNGLDILCEYRMKNLMASFEAVAGNEPGNRSSREEPVQSIDAMRKPRILLAATGSVAALKFVSLCQIFSQWAEVKAVATRASLCFIDRASLPKDVIIYTDGDEWSSWRKIGDSVLHIELKKWADIMVIAPLSANTLGKIAERLCDNLLTCLVDAWDWKKPLFVAPAMNTLMWSNPFTELHVMSIDNLGILLIPPIRGEMAEPSTINSTVRLFYTHKFNRVAALDALQDNALRKPRILLAASGSVAAIKFAHLCRSFSVWSEVRAIATSASFHFIDRASLPKDVILYTDEEELSRWNTEYDSARPVELRHWADIMVIAPLSANTLAKIARGLCDNLLSSVVYAWDHNKPLYVAPAMNAMMWNNPFTEKHLKMIRDELGVKLILPRTKNGAMAEIDVIDGFVKDRLPDKI
ncbi:hypothetical protein TB2_013435 [Malus domestica]